MSGGSGVRYKRFREQLDKSREASIHIEYVSTAGLSSVPWSRDIS